VSYPERGGSSLADPHRIGPFGGWHFGSMAGRTLRGVAPSPETLRSRRASAGGLDGQMVTGGPGVSALGSSPVRQREVLLARVLLLLRAQKAWKGRRAVRGQRRRGTGCLSRACSLGTEGPPSRSSKSFCRRSSGEGRSRERARARGLPSQDFFLREEGQFQTSLGKRGFDEVDETWGSVLAG